MNDQQHDNEDFTVSIRAEQAVLGGLLADNEALDRAGQLEAAHFYRQDHRLVFEEIQRQVAAGRRSDPLTVAEKIGDKVDDCLPYLARLRSSAVSGHRVPQHAEIVIEKAKKRGIAALGAEMMALASSHQDAGSVIDMVAGKLEEMAQARIEHEPLRMSVMMPAYSETVTARYEGRIVPIATGWADLDERMDGGVERGTLTVVAGRPSMGKTAFGLGLARNVAVSGVSLFLSMEMSRDQVNDRNVSAIGKIPLKWLKRPGAVDLAGNGHWDALAEAFKASQSLNLFIDDQTGLDMLRIRAKARKVKRQAGARLDVLVIDQLSFITGGRGDKWEVTGEYTRALVALAKDLDIAVVLLCQLNRKCEERPNKRPMMSDLAVSGSIEQDAANILFLYRDEIYNPDTPDKGICEINAAKLRQGDPGKCAMVYIGAQTRFENLSKPWVPAMRETAPAHQGFD